MTFINIVITNSIFKLSGKTPVSKLIFIMCAKTVIICEFAVLKILVETTSNPGYLLELRLFMTTETSAGQVGVKIGEFRL